MKHLLAVAASIGIAAAAHAAEVPGFARIALDAPHRDAVVQGAIWYPGESGGEALRVGENAVFLGVPVRDGAAAAEGRHPVVLFSHGLGGRFETIAWLPAGLAARGAIVVSLNHPGSTWSDFNVRRAAEHWTRVHDLKMALDWLLSSPEWMGRVDESRIAAVGFSYGGWTALSMGGATGNLVGYAAYCDKYGARATDCRMLARAGIEPGALDTDRWNASYKDRRIGAVAAIDPAVLYGLGAGNVEHLVGDVLLVGLGTGADRYLPVDFSPSGSGFSALLPHAVIAVIAPARHFTALGVCKPRGAAILRQEGDDPLCDDPNGTDRNAVHRRIVDLVADHLGLGG